MIEIGWFSALILLLGVLALVGAIWLHVGNPSVGLMRGKPSRSAGRGSPASATNLADHPKIRGYQRRLAERGCAVGFGTISDRGPVCFPGHHRR
jgi:hypothetical protein